MATRKNPAAVALGRRGGLAKSDAKARAARRNGQRGGRTMKFALKDRARANDHAPGDYRERVGVIVEIGPGRSEYGVRFADREEPAHGYLMSWWLDRVAE